MSSVRTFIPIMYRIVLGQKHISSLNVSIFLDLDTIDVLCLVKSNFCTKNYYQKLFNPFATVIVFFVDFCVCPTVVPYPANAS